MTVTTCNNCGGSYEWHWEDAFDKFGFNDGEGQIETWTVGHILELAGYTVEIVGWGLHNSVIHSLKLADEEFIPEEDSEHVFGYDNPRNYLPKEIIKLLDENL